MKSSIEESFRENMFIWEYERINVNPCDRREMVEWIPYSNRISSIIEESYQQDLNEIFIDGNYRIDLKSNVQEDLNDLNRQESIRRRCICSINSMNERTESRCERFSSPLGLVLNGSATEDTTYYGSPFVHTWLVNFTKGKMKIRFDTIFPVLVKGLIKEGEINSDNNISTIERILIKVEEDTSGQKSQIRIKELQNCCAKLYTKGCYIYRAVNATLRDDDRTKLDTLGPFCYLLFNYIGLRFKDNSSIRHRLKKILHSKQEIQSVIVYRGDRNVGNILDIYQQAIGDPSKYFKWLPFVSTTRDRIIAERFAIDLLYIIEIPSYSTNEDQFTDLTTISDYKSEQEILLLPGIQFQIKQIKFDYQKRLYLIYIIINSSYISKLK